MTESVTLGWFSASSSGLEVPSQSEATGRNGMALRRSTVRSRHAPPTAPELNRTALWGFGWARRVGLVGLMRSPGVLACCDGTARAAPQGSAATARQSGGGDRDGQTALVPAGGRRCAWSVPRTTAVHPAAHLHASAPRRTPAPPFAYTSAIDSINLSISMGCQSADVQARGCR